MTLKRAKQILLADNVEDSCALCNETHERLPVSTDVDRQFLCIMSKGVSGRESYFTENPLLKVH